MLPRGGNAVVTEVTFKGNNDDGSIKKGKIKELTRSFPFMIFVMP